MFVKQQDFGSQGARRHVQCCSTPSIPRRPTCKDAAGSKPCLCAGSDRDRKQPSVVNNCFTRRTKVGEACHASMYDLSTHTPYAARRFPPFLSPLLSPPTHLVSLDQAPLQQCHGGGCGRVHGRDSALVALGPAAHPGRQCGPGPGAQGAHHCWGWGHQHQSRAVHCCGRLGPAPQQMARTWRVQQWHSCATPLGVLYCALKSRHVRQPRERTGL